LVIFGIGINDAVSDNFREEIFVNNYNKLIERIKNISPDCAFIFITNNDSYKNVRQAYTRKKRRRYRTVSVVNRNGETAATAFYEIARQNNGAVWNQFEIMGGLKSMQQWQNASLAAHDKIHFTKTGYELLGDLFFNAILQKKSVE
jgi:lysophospholipase L1-like esterase